MARHHEGKDAVRPRLVSGGRTPRGPEVKLTPEEHHVLNLLVEAWNAYAQLPIQHPSDRHEFAFYLRGCQGLVGLRVARAADPDMWAVEDGPG